MITCVIKRRVWNMSFDQVTVSIDPANNMRFYLSDDLVSCSTVKRTRVEALTLARDILLSTHNASEEQIERLLIQHDDMMHRTRSASA